MLKKPTMRLLLAFLTIIPLTTLCQNVDTIETKKLSIGLSFSPDYSYRILKPDASGKWIAEIRDTLEIPKFGYTTGLNIALKINKRITLEMGFLYSDKGEKTKSFTPIWVSPAGQPDPDPDLPSKITYFNHYIYLDFPVKANYYLLTQRVKFFLTAGISPNIFLKHSVTSICEYNDGHTSTKTSLGNNGFTKINLAFIAGLGLGYDLTKKLNLIIEPTYRRSITPIIDAPIKGYLYSFGLNTGLYYNL
jgi:hypothetical protein